MGKNFKDLGDIEDGFGLWKFDGGNHGAHGGIVFAKGFRGFGVGPMAWFDGDDVAGEFASREHEVTDEVEGLMACELIVEAHRLLGHDFFPADDDCVFKRTAFDEALVEKGFDVFVKGEGTRGRDFVLVKFGGDDAGEVLHEASVFADVSDGDAELFVGNDGDERSVAGFEMNGLTDFPDFTRGGLFFEAGFFDELDVRARGAVTDWWFIGVHFNEGVVDSHTDQGGEDVLDGVNADRTFGKGGCTLDGLDFRDTGINEGLVGEVDTPELEAVAFRSGF